MAKGLFITASGTEIGKTLVACALAHQIGAKGEDVTVLKPVISGFDANDFETSDSALLLEAAGKQATLETISAISPWRFDAPIAPNMAALRAGKPIDLAAVIQFCNDQLSDKTTTVIEGVGGVMAPITDHKTVIDWMAGIDLSAIIVVGSYLGALSHGLTAIGALQRRNIAIAGIIISESEDAPVALEETKTCFENFVGEIPVRALPRLKTDLRNWESAPDFSDLLP
ncbi:MAG: dethiobiotin synthase [Rhodospirillales bacterium]|jgi:dethiobiotin synthetase|nr:dethiobiotin synthase [Rhodospirillales bacterium]MBT5075962.1 dethiobiotin synthase [Rhodospirillales bacterium]MBT5112995.1 dethiobiotin synthase [Rhodospirillales bacterium]MBT5672871.1 dethiobiotin synthase [Rhodospirillales bacterium]MBT6187548.1 dethiobiotin synthase [Rhodospirillales bacterium]